VTLLTEAASMISCQGESRIELSLLGSISRRDVGLVELSRHIRLGQGVDLGAAAHEHLCPIVGVEYLTACVLGLSQLAPGQLHLERDSDLLKVECRPIGLDELRKNSISGASRLRFVHHRAISP
jgi:hypothetical protein